MDKLEIAVKVFKQILDKNLSVDEPNHYEIINCLGNVFHEANKALNALTTLEEKGKVFDLMKTLNPYLLHKKEEIVEKLGIDKGEKSVELKLALAVYDKESLAYSKHLRLAKKEKIKKKKKKGKTRDYL